AVDGLGLASSAGCSQTVEEYSRDNAISAGFWAVAPRKEIRSDHRCTDTVISSELWRQACEIGRRDGYYRTEKSRGCSKRERRALPAYRFKHQGLRNYCAESRGTNYELERRSATDQGIQSEGDSGPAFFNILSSRGHCGWKTNHRTQLR